MKKSAMPPNEIPDELPADAYEAIRQGQRLAEITNKSNPGDTGETAAFYAELKTGKPHRSAEERARDSRGVVGETLLRPAAQPSKQPDEAVLLAGITPVPAPVGAALVPARRDEHTTIVVPQASTRGRSRTTWVLVVAVGLVGFIAGMAFRGSPPSNPPPVIDGPAKAMQREVPQPPTTTPPPQHAVPTAPKPSASSSPPKPRAAAPSVPRLAKELEKELEPPDELERGALDSLLKPTPPPRPRPSAQPRRGGAAPAPRDPASDVLN